MEYHMENDPLAIRRPYQNIILNLTKNADICAEQWSKTQESEWMAAYYMYVKKIEEIKKDIKEKEDKNEN